jgi:hypothetical protein
MRVEWRQPVTLHIHPDVTDTRASQLRRSDDGVVQVLLGSEMSARAWPLDASGAVAAAPGAVLQGVMAIEFATGAEDDTILNASAGHEQASVQTVPPVPPAPPMPPAPSTPPVPPAPPARSENDVDDTILGQSPLNVEDDDTILGGGRARLAAPPAAPQPHAIVFPDGRIVALDRVVYVGRSPRSPRITSGVAPELVTVASPLREVSATHLQIHQEGRAVVVRDLGSTNGTRVTAPGVAPSLLSPGGSRAVAPGARLDLGDGVVLEIVAAIGQSW